MCHDVAPVIARYLENLARERVLLLKPLRSDPQTPLCPQLHDAQVRATAASLALLSHVVRRDLAERWSISRELEHLGRLLRSLLQAQRAICHQRVLLATHVVPDILLCSAQHLAVRSCALLGMVVALSCAPSALSMTLVPQGSIVVLTITADVLALAWDAHPLYHQAQSISQEAGLVLWQQRCPRSWQLVASPCTSTTSYEALHA